MTETPELQAQDIIDEFLPKPDMSEVTQPPQGQGQPAMPGIPGDMQQPMPQGMPQAQPPQGTPIPEIVAKAKASLEASQPLNPIGGMQ